MATRLTIFLFATCTLLSSCKILAPSMNTLIANGDYTLKSKERNSTKIYLDYENEEMILSSYNQDSIEIHLLKESNKIIKPIFLNQRNKLDIDLITTPVKFRPGQMIMQPQLNAGINASIFLGLRNNYNIVSYRKGYNKYQRYISSYGLSYGLFAGLSNTNMNPWVTNNNISQEYDGVVFTKGVTSILGLNKFTIGLSLGFDNLLDPNHKYWVYEGKPWVGVSLGLNIN